MLLFRAILELMVTSPGFYVFGLFFVALGALVGYLGLGHLGLGRFGLRHLGRTTPLRGGLMGLGAYFIFIICYVAYAMVAYSS